MGIMNTRVSGACALGLSVITWLARDIKSLEFQRVVAFGNLTTLGLLVFVGLHGIITGAINDYGWVIFFADLLLSIGFVFFLIKNTGQLK